MLYENGVNGILADEMGLGKTVQCVAILAHLVYMGIPGPFLVCAPLSTIPNWFAEFRRFAPEVNWLIGTEKFSFNCNHLNMQRKNIYMVKFHKVYPLGQ